MNLENITKKKSGLRKSLSNITSYEYSGNAGQKKIILGRTDFKGQARRLRKRKPGSMISPNQRSKLSESVNSRKCHRGSSQ